jgi:serine/threonine protein kinase
MHLIQELATGGDLFAYMEKHDDGLSEDEVRFLGWQLVEGLKYLHGNGIVHRGKLSLSRYMTFQLTLSQT